MAEVFGVIGAGVGVAAAAGQLIDGIMKLHSFCSRIQNIPEDIQTTVDDLSTMIEVLEFVQIEMDYETPPLQPSDRSSSFMKVLLNLQQSSLQVGEVLEEMQLKLGKKKYWGRIKAVGLTKKLEKAAKRVENAQRMILILLAVQNRISFRQTATVQCVQRRVDPTVSTHVLSLPSASQCTGKILGGACAIHHTGGTVTTDDDTYSADPATSIEHLRKMSKAKRFNTARLKLRLPHFFLNSVWELSVYKSNQGWDFSLQSYNTRPWNAPIFEAIYNGDLAQVCELIHSGRASIWDRNSLNQGVLHYAARSCGDHGSRILEYLVKSGANIYDVDSAGFPPYYSFVTHAYMDKQKSLHIVEGYKVFMSHRDWIPSRPRTWVPFENCKVPGDIIDMFPIYRNPPEETICSLLNDMWPPWKDTSPTDRMNILFPHNEDTRRPSTLTGQAINPLCIRACLSRSYLQKTFASWNTREKSKLIDYSFNALADQLLLVSEKGIEEARLFLKDMHTTNSLIDTLIERDRLRLFVNHYMFAQTRLRAKKFITTVQEGLNHYISELALLGIDMATVVYIERETRAIYKGRRSGWRIHHSNGNWYYIIAIDYGLKPDDWHLWLSNPLDEWAGEFWDMIDHPERAMPGAWEY